MKTTIGKLKKVIKEAMVSASALPSSIKLHEEGGDWHHWFILYDEQRLTDTGDMEQSLVGGISLERQGVGWSVGSVAALKGHGPLLYRAAMQFASPDGGLRKNAGGNTSPAAGNVWSRFEHDPGVRKVWDAENARSMYVMEDRGDLEALRRRSSRLEGQQAGEAKGLVRGLWTSTEE